MKQIENQCTCMKMIAHHYLLFKLTRDKNNTNGTQMLFRFRNNPKRENKEVVDAKMANSKHNTLYVNTWNKDNR
jgi:hypothetical protein